MVFHRLKNNNCVGIYTELKYDGTVNILMREYIKEGILAFGGLMGK